MGRGGGGGGADEMYDEYFVGKRQGMHRIGVAEHLGVRLLASPPPWASTSERTEAEKKAFLRQRSRRHHCITVLLFHTNQDAEYLGSAVKQKNTT